VFPTGVAFADDDQTTIFVNINGNLSFTAADPTFTPEAIPGLTQPTIAPYFADLDLRDSGFGAGENTSTVTICEEPDNGRLLFTWSDVPFYNAAMQADFDELVTFQAVLMRLPELCGEADGL
jgi:hypothetical protein